MIRDRLSMGRLLWEAMEYLVNRQSLSWPAIATTVREHYERLVAPEYRLVIWSDHPDTYKRARNDAQTLRRFHPENDHRTGDHDLPIDFINPILLTLRELEYRHYDALETMIALQRRRVSVPVIDGNGPVMLYTGAAVMGEAAEAVKELADLEADGEIDHHDQRGKLMAARVQVAELLGAAAYAMQRIEQALEEQDVQREAR